jgi:para-aminobenzoate synthetase component I
MAKELELRNIKFDNHLFLNISKLFSNDFGTCILYSGGTFDSSSHSFLCAFPYESFWIDNKKLWKESGLISKREQCSVTDPWESLKEVLTYSGDSSYFPEWVGYFAYELGMSSDRDKKSSPLPSQLPIAYFQKYALVLAIEHSTGRGRVKIKEQGLYLPDENIKQWIQRLSLESKWEELAVHLKFVEEDFSSFAPLDLAKPRETFEEYNQKIKRVQDLILSGDLYQVNLSHQFFLKGTRDPYLVFRRLVKINPSPFSVYMRFKNFTIVSSSPERFLRKQDGWLETRPIKGTIARGKTILEDQKNLETLLNSAKDNAELLMITDLMRNDLGKISLPGSVKTTQIRTFEAYENVYHLLSIIKSQALPGLNAIDILRSCFPGGSITGCPKLSAMETIANLEKRPREIYTGSIGYFTGNGDFDFNIAIRTLLIKDQQIDLQLGGAIVADSDPLKEYEETLHKGASIFKALQFENRL